MQSKSKNSFNTLKTFNLNGKIIHYFSIQELAKKGFEIERLPYSLKILLENLLRHEDGVSVKKEDIEALLSWNPKSKPEKEIAFSPARVIMQDFTGVPALVDLATLRDVLTKMNGDAKKINPLIPTELVIDHSVQVDSYGTEHSFSDNVRIEFERNRERYAFLRWGQRAFDNFKVVPPGTGIVHQVNIEYLARVIFENTVNGQTFAYPDTVVGTDSHTTMVNGLGVVGWGVGGIEAEAAMLGQSIPLLIPQVVGFKLTGSLPEGATATDLVLTVTQMLRKKGVVGKFVEFYGSGVSSLSLADRTTLSNMAPEYGATIGIFPPDSETLEYLSLTGREESHIKLVEEYTKKEGLFYTKDTHEPMYSDSLSLDLATVEPSLAGPRRPQDRISLHKAKESFKDAYADVLKNTAPHHNNEITHGSVVIAAITSCTNTSNPSVLIGAGLLARNAVKRGLTSKPWVKTSLAPGSQVVTEYLEKAGLLAYLNRLGFHLVGYGCTTCIGNSGPLRDDIAKTIEKNNLTVAAVLSGNRNFEGRIHPHVRANYLASPPLVVAYALAGTMDFDFLRDPLGKDTDGKNVFLKDVWPSDAEIEKTILSSITKELFRKKYQDVFKGSKEWNELKVPQESIYRWDSESTYIQPAHFLEKTSIKPQPICGIESARILAIVGDSVTTDHISPAGSIPKDSPAAEYLKSHGVEYKDFNSFGARRGNDAIMMRGTFGNIHLKNMLVDRKGGWTRVFPDGNEMTIFDAAVYYQKKNIPLMVIAGKEYGSGSSRDWAAKGTLMLGVRAVIAESYERIHRSNLIGMGVLPLEFLPNENRETLKLQGTETYTIQEIENDLHPGKKLTVSVTDENKNKKTFKVLCRIDTPIELEYYKHGGVLPYVLRKLQAG